MTHRDAGPWYFGWNIVAAAPVMPLAGYLVARKGTRFVLLTGVVLVALATVWSVTTRTPLGFLASFGILMSVGLAFTSPVALTPVISRWFNRRRGMALFFLSTGYMAGIAVLTVPIALYIMRDQAPADGDLPVPSAAATATPAQPVPEPLGMAQAMRTGTFIKITLGLFACGFSMNL